MNEVIGQILLRLEAFERSLRQMEQRFESKPEIEMSIKARDTDALIDQLEKMCRHFPNCNLKIKIELEESA